METWKPIPFAPGYDVSDLGRVRSWRPWGGRGKTVCAGSRLKSQRKDRNGYFRVTLIVAGRLESHWVSRLVARVFLGEPPAGKPYACHDDGNPENNSLANLKWGDQRDNGADMIRHGRSLPGERNASAKLGENDAREVLRMLSRGSTQQAVADCFGLHQAHVSRIALGKCWKHLQPTEAGA